MDEAPEDVPDVDIFPQAGRWHVISRRWQMLKGCVTGCSTYIKGEVSSSLILRRTLAQSEAKLSCDM